MTNLEKGYQFVVSSAGAGMAQRICKIALVGRHQRLVNLPAAGQLGQMPDKSPIFAG